MDKNSFSNERLNLALSRATRQSDGNNKKTILINSDLDIDFFKVYNQSTQSWSYYF